MLPGAEFHAVQHQVVALRAHRQAHFVRRILELGDVFLDDSGEGMLRADHRLFRGIPFKEREARDPREFPAVLGNQFQLLREQQAQLPGDQRGSIGAGNLFLGA